MNLASVVIAGRSLNATPESVFIGVAAIISGLLIWRGGIWWHKLIDWALAIFAVTAVPRLGAEVSRVSTQSWAGYGVPLILLGIVLFALFKK